MEYTNQEKTYYEVNCTTCGDETQVPFKPIDGKKILCSTCFRKAREEKKNTSSN